MSERFGPNFALGSFALQQSIRLVYTIRALSRDRNRGTRATRSNQDGHTERAHTRSATETQHNSQPKTPKGSWPLLLPHRRPRPRCRCCCCCCCCCCGADVLLLLHDPQCIAEHIPSQQTVAFEFFRTHAGASNGTAAAAAAAATAAAVAVATAAAAAAQQLVQQQGRPNHMYEYTIRHQAG